VFVSRSIYTSVWTTEKPSPCHTEDTRTAEAARSAEIAEPFREFSHGLSRNLTIFDQSNGDNPSSIFHAEFRDRLAKG
jgi:hypothetical protein